jgi:tetratricopeptide (TPR) repeat protein
MIGRDHPMTQGATTSAALPVELAREPDFWLGALHVRPSICQVVFGGDTIDLQPKIMQVLVVLSRAKDHVVSRSDLTAICWGDVVVGDGSLHRCVARLRRLSQEEAPGVFSIISQARVGYRLVLHDPAALEPGMDHNAIDPLPPWSALGGVLSRRPITLSIAAILLMGVSAALLTLVRPTRAPYRVAVRNFKVEGLGAGIGESLADRVAAAVSDRDLLVVSRSRSSRGDFGGARFIVGGDIRRISDQLKVAIQLDDASSGLTLWTRTITRSSAEADALQDQVGAKVADVMALARNWLGPNGDSAKPEVVAALFNATDSIRGLSPTMIQTREAFRQFRDLAPQSSGAHSAYAMATVLGSYNQTREVASDWRREAAVEAQRAITLDPKNGEGYLALGLLSPDSDLAKREGWFSKGLQADPNNASLANFLGELLLDVGRVDDGVIWIDRSTKLDPLSGPKTQSFIAALAITGRFGDADRLIERSRRLWPDDIGLRREILFRSLIYASPTQSMAMLDQFQASDKPLPDDHASMWRSFEKARVGELSAESVGKRLAAINLSSKMAGRGANAGLASFDSDELSALICALASLGDSDDAFRTLNLSRSMQLDLDSSVLFEPAMQALRKDPRFSQVAKDLGLVRYWTEAHHKPDFCATQPKVAVCS